MSNRGVASSSSSNRRGGAVANVKQSLGKYSVLCDVEVWVLGNLQQLYPHLFGITIASSPGARNPNRITTTLDDDSANRNNGYNDDNDNNDDDDDNNDDDERDESETIATEELPPVSTTKPKVDRKPMFYDHKDPKLLPYDKYFEPPLDAVYTFCVKMPGSHIAGEYLIHEYTFHQHCKLGEKWKGFYNVYRRKWRPHQFTTCYYVNASRVDTDSYWKIVQKLILDHFDHLCLREKNRRSVSPTK